MLPSFISPTLNILFPLQPLSHHSFQIFSLSYLLFSSFISLSLDFLSLLNLHSNHSLILLFATLSILRCTMQIPSHNKEAFMSHKNNKQRKHQNRIWQQHTIVTKHERVQTWENEGQKKPNDGMDIGAGNCAPLCSITHSYVPLC